VTSDYIQDKRPDVVFSEIHFALLGKLMLEFFSLFFWLNAL
jgi:hypothetical protein